MKLIDLLAKLVRDDDKLSPRERADARELIAELRKINALGTLAGSIDIKHECVPQYHPPERIDFGPTKGAMSGAYYDCQICGRNMNV